MLPLSGNDMGDSMARDTREHRLRMTLKRRLLGLVKCRRRDPMAHGYGLFVIRELRGRGKDATATGPIVAGAGKHEDDWSSALTLDDVERFVTPPRKKKG